MKGDFSWFDYTPGDNYTGVLEQQGRVRLDRDGNAAEEIGRHLRNLMGRDAFGPDRVAVPAEQSGSLRITAATTDGTTVSVTIDPGRAWIDGIPLFIGEVTTEDATYLPPPFQPEIGPDSIAADARDAVVLEVWEDSLSAFQEPEALLESALGGVDTTERVKVCHRLRLRRLAEDEDCSTIGPSLRDNPATIGRLTVTPAPAIVITGDCPVDAGGGYTGDGHNLFCIEITQPGPGGPRFTWSRFGGGLVGRGRFDDVADEITITRNQPMIDAADVAGFHLQALEPDPASGCWTLQFEATVSLTDGVLTVTDPIGTWPAAAGEDAFFRLWDRIEDISGFTGGANELANGIMLDFDPIVNSGENYRPGDRWLFPVRAAGGGFDPSVWPQNALPTAIRYHRAPLGILTWTSAPPDILTAPDDIEDCRDSFPPLTDPCPCCTITVGDGHSSHGDTNSIEEAIDLLPTSGGKICLLPGLHETNAVIRDRSNIRITGCGKDTRVIPRSRNREAPIFHVIDSECILLADMDMISLSGVAVLGESSDDDALRQFAIAHNRILACIRAIQIERGSETLIRDNRIRMLDKAGAGVAVFLTGEDSRIEDNDIGVVPAETTPVPPDRPDDPDNPDDPNDPCADADLIYANFGFFIGFVEFVFGFTLTAILPPPYQALGGIQIGAGAERVAVIDNRILGGAGNGVTLGGSHLAADDPDGESNGPLFQDVALSRTVLLIRAAVIAPDGDAAVGVTVRVTAPSGQAVTEVTDSNGVFEIKGSREQGDHRFETLDSTLGVDSAEIVNTINFGQGSLVMMRIELNRQRETPDQTLGFLYAIRIEDNEITAMGLNGIGIPPAPGVLGDLTALRGTDNASVALSTRFSITRATAVNPLLALLGNPVIDLTILNNRITGNLQTPFTAAMLNAARSRGFGGISLGFCETVIIAGNRIEANGRRHVDPVCGIFVLLGEQVEITDNLIRDNGPFVRVDAEIERGLRGGIAGIFLSIGLDDLILDRTITGSKPALRVHDNIVQQPMGRALTAIGAGPISVVANHLSSERTGEETLDRMAGAALVFSVSGIGALPSGGCLVNSNQITLGPSSSAFIAVALAAGEDIGLEGNQIDALQAGLVTDNSALMLNTLIFGQTARATDNRFRERALNAKISRQVSLLSMTTQMNIASLNEGNHCIFAFDQSNPPRLVDRPNLVLDSTLCEDVRDGAVGAAKNPVLGVATLQNLSLNASAEQPTGIGLTYSIELNQNLSRLNGFLRGQLASAAEIKAASRALLVNEVARLEIRSNTRADLLAATKMRLDAVAVNTDRLRAAAEVVATKPRTDSPEGGLVIQGRATDRNARGLALREVQLADAEGTPIRGVKPVRTDATGAYVIRLTKAQVKRVSKQIEDGATIRIEPDDGAEPVLSPRFTIKDRAVIAPDLRLRSGRAAPALSGPAIVRQPLTRPVLTGATRPRATSGRIAPLIRRSRPTRPEEE